MCYCHYAEFNYRAKVLCGFISLISLFRSDNYGLKKTMSECRFWGLAKSKPVD